MSRNPPTRIKTAAVSVPRTREEAEALLGAIGRAQREVTRIEADLNDRVSTLKAEAGALATPFNEAIEADFKALHAYAEAHREELCPSRIKTAKLATGELTWRIRPPSVRITGGDKVIDALLRLGLGRFIRTKNEVNKDAILEEPDAVKSVKGISVTTGVEDFVAKPYETEIERAEPAGVSPS